MSKRTVQLKLTTQKDVVTTEVSATTFGELQTELKDINFKNMKVIVRETRNTLESPDALLPAGDFMLFVMPVKVKSGALEKLEDIDNASYNDLRSHASYLNSEKSAGIDMSGDTKKLRKAVKKYYKKNATEAAASSINNEEAVVAIEEARAKINETLDNVVDIVKNAEGGSTEEYVIAVTMADLDAEMAELKKQLKL